MTPQKQSTLGEKVTATGEARTLRHQVSFQFLLTALDGQPLNEETAFYKTLSAADEDMYSLVPRRVPHWCYKDEHQIECERLEICQPEFAHEEGLPETARLYEITLMAHGELPLARQDPSACPEHRMSVEQLMEDVPPVVERIYAEHGVTLKLQGVSFSKHVEQMVQGKYTLS